MKKMLFAFALSVCANFYAAEKAPAAQNVVQQPLPVIIYQENRPHLLHPVFSKYAWAKDGNGWKGYLLPMYHLNPQMMPMPQA